ncbi:hypothetical protein PVK06_001712 [Gossypium arboreum]|uniref:Uncharacterized protein n=1 Tax=Gossypium arboreum TaxID=29729 RepID=A0ABR0R1X8_GOSAR|nr:hypothetical protein PVK06_001712 [Gossypium arboreum]
MFGAQDILVQQFDTTSLMNAHQKPDTQFKDYMITLMSYFAEVVDNEENLD